MLTLPTMTANRLPISVTLHQRLADGGRMFLNALTIGEVTVYELSCEANDPTHWDIMTFAGGWSLEGYIDEQDADQSYHARCDAASADALSDIGGMLKSMIDSHASDNSHVLRLGEPMRDFDKCYVFLALASRMIDTLATQKINFAKYLGGDVAHAYNALIDLIDECGDFVGEVLKTDINENKQMLANALRETLMTCYNVERADYPIRANVWRKLAKICRYDDAACELFQGLYVRGWGWNYIAGIPNAWFDEKQDLRNAYRLFSRMESAHEVIDAIAPHLDLIGDEVMADANGGTGTCSSCTHVSAAISWLVATGDEDAEMIEHARRNKRFEAHWLKPHFKRFCVETKHAVLIRSHHEKSKQNHPQNPQLRG